MRSISQKLTASLVVAFTLLVGSGAVVIYLAVREGLYEQFDAGLRVKALMVITATEQRRGRINVEFSDRFLREFDDDVASDFFQVWAIGGSANVERSDSLGRRDLPQQFGDIDAPKFWNIALPLDQAAGRAIGIRFRPRTDDDDERTRRNPIDAVVVVAGRRAALDATLQRLGWILGGVSLGLLGALCAAVPVVLRPGLRPLRQLGDQAAGIDANSLGQRFPAENIPVELRPIVERLNALLGRLESSFQRERRFSSDLAHELLTPLAELRVIVDAGVKWPDTLNPATLQQALGILVRMENLVTRLLELCRAEQGRITVTAATADLSQLVNEAWRPFAERARVKGIDPRFEGPAPCSVTTDVGLLRIVLGNLCSNAVEYAPAGATLKVEWGKDADAFHVSFSNPAPDLLPEEAEKMFERFWRKDPARTGGQHSGLGLSVARELAIVLGGSLNASLATDGNVTFTVIAPDTLNAPGSSPNAKPCERAAVG